MRWRGRFTTEMGEMLFYIIRLFFLCTIYAFLNVHPVIYTCYKLH